MAQQQIENGETGLVVREKINDNFDELYTANTTLVGSTGASRVGASPRGDVAPAVVKSVQDWKRRGLDLADWEGDAENGRFAPGNDASDAVEAFLNAALELTQTQRVFDPGTWEDNITTRPASQVECRFNGNGGVDNDALNRVVITREIPYLSNGARYVGSPDTILTSGTNGLQLLRTIDGQEAQTVWRNGALQPYGTYDVVLQNLLIDLGETASDALFLQTSTNFRVINSRIWGGLGSAWSMPATSSGTNVLTVASTATVKRGQIITVSTINLPSGQPRRFMVRAVASATTLLLDKVVPAGSYTIAHTAHAFVGAMFQQSEIHGLVVLGAQNAGYMGMNNLGFGCTDNKIIGGMHDFCGSGWYESTGNFGNRYLGRSMQYSTAGSELILDGAINCRLEGFWSEATVKHSDNVAIPVVEAVETSVTFDGWAHAHNNVFKRMIRSKDAAVTVTGFTTTTNDLPVNPSSAGDYALALVDGGTLHCDWGGDFTNVVGGVPLRDQPEKLVLTTGGANFGFALASTSGLPNSRVSTQRVAYRGSDVTAPVVAFQEAGAAHPSLGLTPGRIRLGTGAATYGMSIYYNGNQLDLDKPITTPTGYLVNYTQVVGAQGAAVPDASGGPNVDTEARAAINTLLARLRVHGLIAT